MDFVALDVETANTDVGSICQIGLAAYEDGTLIREWVSLIDPEEKFSYFNIQVHGLKVVCGIIGYEFKHHDALEDAKAAGAIVLAAERKTGLTFSAWLKTD